MLTGSLRTAATLLRATPDAYIARAAVLAWIESLDTSQSVRAHVLTELLGPKRRKPPYLEFTGLMVYDMAYGPARRRENRQRFALSAAMLGHALDLADDVLDTYESSFQGRTDFLREIEEAALNGECGAPYRTIAHEATFTMAARLHRDLFSTGSGPIQQVFRTLINVNTAQFQSTDIEHIVSLEMETGSLVVECIAALLETIEDRSFPEARAACRAIGAFGQLLDNWTDIYQDLDEGVNTLGSLLLRANPGCPRIEHAIGEQYQKHVSMIAESRVRMKTPEAERAVQIMMTLLRFKYRRAVRVERHRRDCKHKLEAPLVSNASPEMLR